MSSVDHEFTEGNIAIYKCKTNNAVSPEVEYAWYLNGESLMTASRDINLLLNRSMNEQTLTCEAFCHTSNITVVSEEFHLFVQCKYS